MTLQSLRHDLGTSERDLKSTTGRNTIRGIESAMKVAADQQLSGVHGPLIQVFTCDPRFDTAVEVTAGNRYVCVSCELGSCVPVHNMSHTHTGLV